MEPQAEALVAGIVEQVRRHLPETVERSATRTWAEVEAYGASTDRRLPADLRTHTRAVFEAVLGAIMETRRATRADFSISVAQARRRVRQGVTLADFMQGFRIGQETLWQAIVEAADPDPAARDAALDLAIHVMNAIEVGSSLAAETYMLAAQLELADGDRLARDLVEDLLTGRPPSGGPKADLAVASDLTSTTRLRVVEVVAAGRGGDPADLREVLEMLRRRLGTSRRGVVVLRQDHVVGVVPVTDDGADVVAALRRVRDALARRLPLAVGVSTVHEGLAAVPDAQREAAVALGCLADAAGVVDLAALTPLDYLVRLQDPTALRLVRPEWRAFVETDLACGGTDVETLLAYAASDLNATVAAERLHVHVNTAYYRLNSISEKTGCDLRRFADLQELLVAVRLLGAPGTPPEGTEQVSPGRP